MKLATRLTAAGAALLMAVGGLTACGTSGSDDGTVIMYSGRSAELVGPLVTRWDSDGTKIDVSYDRKASQILEEGSASPADVFFAQDAGELGRLADAGLLEPLPNDITEVIDQRYRNDSGWAAVTARSRVLAYNPNEVDGADLPAGIDGLLDPKYRGQIGFAPTNASFKSFVTGLRVLRGDDGARDWLTRFLANDPQKFEKNGQILDAVNDGTISLGLINHYYWAAAVQEKGEENVTSRLHFFSGGDPGALVNVSGAAVLKSATDKDAAFEVIRKLLNDDSQRYFAEDTGEYPIVTDVQVNVPGLPRLSELSPPAIDLDDLADLDGTERLLTQVGAL